MTNKMIRDALGGVIPQTLNEDGKFAVLANGDTTGIDFSKKKLLRDMLGSPLPFQYYDIEQDKFVAGVIGGNGGTSDTISANNVITSTSRQFVTSAEKSQITSNTNELSSHSSRLQVIETAPPQDDEKVKMDINDTASFLVDKLDGTTIQNVNGKMTATTLNGLTATLNEINALQGVTGNVQAQINALSNIGNYTTSVATHADLVLIVDMSTNDMVIVLADETQLDAPSTIYIYNGTSWMYSGEFKGGEIRDFTTNPINLAIETVGILQKSKYEKQTAAETSIVDASGNLTATNVEDAITELFIYANNTKTSIANAIGTPLNASDTAAQLVTKIEQIKRDFADNLTTKGVIAYATATLTELVSKVLDVPNTIVAIGVEKTTKLNVSAPYTINIELTDYIPTSDITTSLIEFVGADSGVVHYNINFDNADATDFEPNQFVSFDGTMSLADNLIHDFNMTKDATWIDNGALFRQVIDKNDYQRIDKLNVISGI